MDATLEQLRHRNPEYEKWRRVWPDYRLAYKGGFEFLWQAGIRASWRYGIMDPSPAPAYSAPSMGVNRRRFLKQLEGEPDSVYEAIWDRAEYVNYLGGILNYFDSWLFATPPIIQASEGEDKPDWFAPLMADATGNRVGFFQFIQHQFLEALICRRSGWMLGRQDSVAKKDKDGVVLTAFSAEEIWDWQQSECGELEWVVLGKTADRRDFPDDRKQVETITYLDANQWTTWEVVRNETSEEVNKIGEGVHGLGRVPFVMLEIPHGMWVTDKLYAWAIGLFNEWTRLRSAMLLGCIMQPFISSPLERAQAESKIFGPGICLHLSSGDSVGGGKEDMGWKTPDTKPLEFVWTHFKEAVAEGYRIVHQMSMAVDAKSVASIARSGASKVEDRKSTEVILRGMGAVASQAELQTLQLFSDVYGDDTEWTVDGYDDFSLTEPMDILQMLALGSTLGIKSSTFEKRRQRKAARTVLDGEDESTMKEVEDEIDEAEDQAQEMADAVIAAPAVAGGAAVPPRSPFPLKAPTQPQPKPPPVEAA